MRTADYFAEVAGECGVYVNFADLLHACTRICDKVFGWLRRIPLLDMPFTALLPPTV